MHEGRRKGKDGDRWVMERRQIIESIQREKKEKTNNIDDK
jgi:hypothetical protein